MNLYLAGEELDPWRIAKRVRNQANRGSERKRLTLSVPLAIDDATGLVDTSVADSLNERPGRARPRRRARRRVIETPITEQEERAAVRAALGKLAAGQQAVLWQVAGGLTQAEIAKQRGVTQQATSRLWERARGAFLPAYFDKSRLAATRRTYAATSAQMGILKESLGQGVVIALNPATY